MTDRDWFRGPDWTPEAQEEFERRLNRARPTSRSQYLRIKGLGLVEGGNVEGARELWTRVLQDPESNSLDQVAATEHLADSYNNNDPERATELYRRVIELSPNQSGTSGTQHIKLAQLLIDSGDKEKLGEAGTLLSWWAQNAGSPYPSNHFAWHLARIKLAQALGDRESAHSSAIRALELASSKPPFSRHPTVGLVHTDAETLEWLKPLAR